MNNFIDNDLDDNTYYCYSVSAINSEGLEGEKSNVVCTGTLSQLPASTPADLNALGDNQQIVLSWEASEGSPPIIYQVYRFGEYVNQTTSTSFTDIGLQKNTEYSYYVVASNEMGSSNNSENVQAITTAQSNLLSANTPDNLIVDLPDNLRASEYLDAQAEVSWTSKSFSEEELGNEFELVFQGNPYQPMTIVVDQALYNGINVPDGSMIGVFDGDICVGAGLVTADGFINDSNNQIKVSKDCLLYTSPSPRDLSTSRMPSSA